MPLLMFGFAAKLSIGAMSGGETVYCVIDMKRPYKPD